MDFKILKNKSRIEIIFLSTFFIMLFIPMSCVKQMEISKDENRTSAVWQPLITKEGKINENFGKDFENWISDRFAFREKLIALSFLLQNKINPKYYKTPKGYLDKNTNWTFVNAELKVKDLQEPQMKNVQKRLNEFSRFYMDNNAKLYMLIVPSKADIYREKTYLSMPYGGYKSFETIRKSSLVPVIYPYEELKKASLKEFVFFKTDHHWTDEGAFIGYQALMKEIKKDYPSINIVKKEDFKISKNNMVRSD